MKIVLKRAFFIGVFLCLCIGVFALSYIVVVYTTADVSFDKSKITNSNLSIEVFDDEKRPLKHIISRGDYININLLPKHTIDCFISIEDKDFYKHNGINVKRMFSAMVKNIMSFSFKEGASTISQQLIKNTHLSNEKTIKRKINEIKLTKALEKNFTKDEILEYYLNIIYFGDNCYGIQNASEHYFSHSATKLTLDESALLAGMIKSPNKYHPVKKYNKCIARRNIVLAQLKSDGKISQEQYSLAKSTSTIINLQQLSSTSTYTKSAVQEAESILKLPEKQIALSGYRIYTYNVQNKQISIEKACNNNIENDLSMISMNNIGHIEAYYEKSDIPLISVKRQPASAVKPTLVYAPAINENIIYPCSQILDDEISISGYSPKNIGNKYHGYVSAEYALSQSLNIPAVKILSYVGINKAKNYLIRQNIEFDENDDGLTLALGGMTHGITLKDLTNTYQTLANGGRYIKATFIKYIVDKNGKVVYNNSQLEKVIYREDTAYLVTTMLQQAAKNGTAKKLSDIKYNIASKTGTSSVGKNNLDAYNISYTSEDIVGCWIGNVDNSPIDVVGGGVPTTLVKTYIQNIYNDYMPKNFIKPSSVIEKEIDLSKLENEHSIMLAGEHLPERYREKAIFSRFNLPKTNNLNKLTISAPIVYGTVQNGVAQLKFNAKEYEEYDVYMIVNNQEKLLTTLSSKNGKTTYSCSLEPKQIVSFYVLAKINNYSNNTEIISKPSNIVTLYYSI